MKDAFILKHRGVIAVEGKDAKGFLQRLISNDISKASSQRLVYALLLSPQGRFLTDLFILQTSTGYLIDISTTHFDEIFKKLNIYNLVSEVDIKDVSNDYTVMASENKCDEAFLLDPRNEKLGFRSFVNDVSLFNVQNEEQYHIRRINLLVPDAAYDFIYDKSFPLEYGLEKCDAIDFKKGCYVGQEVTARTFYRGVIRKGLHKLRLDPSANLEKGTEIKVQDKKIGIILGSINNIALGLINEEALKEMKSGSKIIADKYEVEIF